MATVVALVAIFGILISVHEMGHFLMGKALGMRITEFSLGFGPALLSPKWGDTRYSLRVIPLGGYVRLAGMEMNQSDDPNEYPNRPLWQRFSVIFAGPVMNLILAGVIFALAFGPIGTPTFTTSIAAAIPHYPAYSAGIRAGDRITAIDHQPVKTWDELKHAIGAHAHHSTPITMTVVHHGVVHQVRVQPRYDKALKQYIVGIQPATITVHLPPLAAVRAGAVYTVNLTAGWFTYMLKMIEGRAPLALTGPIGIAVYVNQAVQIGLWNLFMLAGALSANLGLFNILPIPVLDGSRLFLLGLEGVRRRPMKPENENMIHMVGFLVLILFVLVITYHDISHLFRTGSAL